MSVWHLLWLMPAVAIIGMGGGLVYAFHWLTAAFESENIIDEILARERIMTRKFWFIMAVFSIVTLVSLNDHMFGLASTAFLFWIPMLAVLGGYTLIAHSRLPQRWILSIGVGVFIATAVFMLENWLYGRYLLPEWTFGIPIGLATAFAQGAKDMLKRETGLSWHYDWPPWDQIFYVTGGWGGYIFVTKFYYSFSFGINDIVLLLMLWLMAAAHSAAAGYLTSASRKPKKP